VNMDEAIFAPSRAALLIGAHGQNGVDGNGGYTAQDWTDTNNKIGPLQTDKEFYDGNGKKPLPASWASPDNVCYGLETLHLGTAATDSAGTSCGYIVPTSYTDFYLADHYDHGANGMSLPNETNGPAGDSVGLKWSNWLSCVQPINKPVGLGEYGLDCKTNPDQ